MKNHSPCHLSDMELAAEVKRLAGCKRETTAAVVSHLAEFDARRLYLGAGLSSLFTYCTEVLRLSEHEAYNRIEAARVTALLADLARKKFAATDRPRASRARSGDSHYVPAAIKRPVWLREGGRCGFVGENGRRCTERGLLEFHHVNPHGEPTVDNIQLRCRAHNAHEADL